MLRNSSADATLDAVIAPASPAEAIRSEDVQGTWRFYVDAAVSTVIIDLKPGGRYTQVIAGNSGERIDCPGGTWSLDGGYLNLTSYRSATRAATGSARWYFGEWHNQLILFAQDDPLSETLLHGRQVKEAVLS